jgi:tRNA(Ile)-lysidine synthase
MGDSIEIAFRRAALELLPEGVPGLAAVSGGADSIALLHLLLRLRRGRPFELTLAHLDHGLRRGAAADRRFVERAAAELGLRCVADRRPVAELRRKGESPEEAARRVRRAFLLETARRTGSAWIATGHTLDDQAETVLMRLARGAGPAALAGMRPQGPGPFVRPLLGIERADLQAWLARRGIASREDPTNRSLRHDRNRVRRLVVPLLAEVLNPRAARHLVEAAARLREDADLLDSLAAGTFAGQARVRAGEVTLPAALFAAHPAPLARRMARLALERAGADPRRISARHLEALLALAGQGRGGRSLHLPGGVEATRSGKNLQIGRRGPVLQ